MLACYAREEESRESETEEIVREHLFALKHPTVLGVRKWLMTLPQGLNPNTEVFDVAREMGVSERWAMGLKVLYQYRETEAFRKLTEE